MTSETVETLKALADLSRLRIVNLLWEAEDLCSCEIERILDLKQSNASRHLHRLRETKLLDTYKKSQWTHYRISQQHRGNDNFLQPIISSARTAGSPFTDDLGRLQNYRERGFSCATIHGWVPFE